MQKKSSQYLPSHSPGGSKRREVGPVGAFGGPIVEEREAVGVSDSTIQKSNSRFL